MALDAGEVYLVVGAHLNSGSFAKANAAMAETKAASDSYQSSLDRGAAAAKKLEAANGRLWSVTKVAAKGAAISVLGVATALGAAAVSAANFDAAMRNVNSIAGLSEKQLKSLEAQVLRLAPAVGVGPTELAKGLYDIVSTGFKANDAMKILTVSSKAAKAGLTDTATATDAITSALKAYGLGAGHAREVSDLFFETVDIGKLNFEQLATSIGTVLPTASALGVPLKELGAAIATITLNGTNAKTATTQLSAIFTAFQKAGPATALAKQTKAWGFESSAAALKSLGLKGVLDRLHATVTNGSHTWSDYFKDVRALRGAQGLEGTANAANLFAISAKAMDEAVKGAGATQKAYTEQSKSTTQQFEKLKASVDVAAITIGAALLPQINAGITALSKWLTQAQKTGELQHFATETAHVVSQVVTYLHSLGPAAEAAFHVVSATIESAIPFVKELLAVLQAIAPAIEDVANAAANLAQALGPGPILAAAAAYLALRRGILTSQVAVGGFTKIMQAGNSTLAGAGPGAAAFAASLGKTGVAAEGAGGKLAQFGRGLVKSIGSPTLIAAGVAGIVLGVLAIRNSVTSLKQEAQDAVNALAELEGGRVAKAAAKIAVAQAKERVTTTASGLGSAATDVAAARAASPGGHPNIADPKITAALQHQRDVILAHQSAVNGLASAELQLAQATGQVKDQADKYGKQLQGLGEKAIESTTKTVHGFRSVTNVVAPAQAQADAFAKALRQNVAASTDLTAAGKAAGNAIAATVQQLGRVPTKSEFKIIADDVAAGKSISKIRADLGWVARAKPKPKVDADTASANQKLTHTQKQLDALGQPVTIPISAPGTDPITTALDSINTKILHLTSNPWVIPVQYATSGNPPGGGGTSKTRKKATGGKTNGPEVSMIGEDGPEYVVPVSPKYRAQGIDLWMAAGRDLGIPGYKTGAGPDAVRGKKRPGKTPPPIHHGLGYDPAALDSQRDTEKSRLEAARTYRQTLASRLDSDEKKKKTLEGEIGTAKAAMGSKNKKTAANAATRHTRLQAQLAALEGKITRDKAARDHQRDVVIPRDTKRYQDALAAAKVGDDHAKSITLWQDRGDAATSAMQLASDQWDAADRKKDQKGRDKAYAAWLTARDNRTDALGHVKKLLEEVQKVVGKTDYGAQIGKQLTDTVAAIGAAQDETAAPGYVAPQPESTSLADYLTAAETAAGDQVDQAIARAALTEDNSDDIAAAQQALALAQGIETRLEGAGVPTDIVTQALVAVKSAQDALTAATAPASLSADQSAQLAQAQLQRDNAVATSASDRAALKAFTESGDLFAGQGITVNVGVQALSGSDPTTQRQIGTEVVKAFGAQPYVPTSTGYYRG